MSGKNDGFRFLLTQVIKDANAIRARAAEALELLNRLDLPDAAGEKCSVCGIYAKGPRQLAEHLYVSHNGPEPEHWSDAYLAEQAKKARKQTKEAA